MKSLSALPLLACVLLLAASPLHAAPASMQQRPDLRLGLARISLHAEQGEFEEAYALLRQLKQFYPTNPHLLLAESDLNERTGNRGGNRAVLDRALALDPENEDIIDRREYAIASQNPFLTGGVIFRNSEQGDEVMERISGQKPIRPDLIAGAAVENNHVDTDGTITLSNGAVSEFQGTRQRATFTLSKLYEGGDELTGSLYTGNEVIGGGIAYQRWDPSGTTSALVDFQKPEWGFLESIIGHGTRDALRLARHQRILPNLEGTLGGGLRRYGLEDNEDVARSLNWDFDLGYSYPYLLSEEEEDTITLGAYYSVDGEYFRSVDTSFTPAGAAFRPFPAISYEVHSLNVSAARKFTSTFYGEAFGGYAYDRLGGEGPVFGGVLEYTPLPDFELSLQFSRSLLGVRGSEETDSAGIYFKWRW